MVQRPFSLQELSHNSKQWLYDYFLHLFTLLQHTTFTKENLIRKGEKIFLLRKFLYAKYCLWVFSYINLIFVWESSQNKFNLISYEYFLAKFGIIVYEIILLKLIMLPDFPS